MSASRIRYHLVYSKIYYMVIDGEEHEIPSAIEGAAQLIALHFEPTSESQSESQWDLYDVMLAFAAKYGHKSQVRKDKVTVFMARRAVETCLASRPKN